MTSIAWLQLLLLGGIAGALGQSVRVLVGLKKEWDAATAKGRTLASRFNPARMLVSVLIGFAAGATSALALVGTTDTKALGAHEIAALLAAGYAGTDLIEGFINRYAVS